MAKKKSGKSSDVESSAVGQSSGKPAKTSKRSKTTSGSAPPSAAPDPAPPSLPPLSKIQGFVIVTIARSQITNASYNPRVISPAQRRKLTASLKKFRLVEPLVWNVRTGNLVGGHQRLSIIDALEGTPDYSLTVARIDVDDATEKALNIALNNPESQGQYDMDLLADVVREIHAEDKTLIQDAGFDSSNLSMLFGDSFLSGEAAEQAAADVPLVDELNSMYQAGADAEKKRKAAGSSANASSASTPSTASQTSPAAQSHANASQSGPSDSSDDPTPGDATDATDADASQPASPSDNAPKQYGKAGWTKEDFKARRDEYRSQRSTLDDANTHLTIVFDSSEQLGSFLEQLGLNQNLDMIDAFTILPLLGVEVDDGDDYDGEGDGGDDGQGDEQPEGDVTEGDVTEDVHG